MPLVGKLKKSPFLQPYLEELLIIMIRIVIHSNRQCTFSNSYFLICCVIIVPTFT